jgi:hypothetical protein
MNKLRKVRNEQNIGPPSLQREGYFLILEHDFNKLDVVWRNVAAGTDSTYKVMMDRYDHPTTGIVKGTAIRDVTPCGLVEAHRRFVGTGYLHIHDKIIKHFTSNQE